MGGSKRGGRDFVPAPRHARRVQPADRRSKRPWPATDASRLIAVKRLYRWLNLTLIHQGIWPLLVALLGAPATVVAATRLPWFAARPGAPALAALLAAVYLAQRPPAVSRGEPPAPEGADPSPGTEGRSAAMRGQARLLLLGVPVLVAAGRLAAGPVVPVAKVLGFGLADVAAFHLIHFGVVARSFASPAHGQAAAVLLFGASWGLRSALLAGVDGVPGSGLLPALGSGYVLGLAVALLSRALRRWPGGAWPAAAVHWLIVYLVVGFVG